jgi:hypothetical protein
MQGKPISEWPVSCHSCSSQGIPFAPLQASNSLYLIEDLSQDPTNAAASTAAASAAQLDAWFQTGTAEAAWNTPSPLHAFLSRVVALRRRHSALLVLIDDLHWLNLHATGGELEVYDAIVALQAALAQVDAEAAATAPPAAAPAVVARAAFSLDTSSTASAAPPAAASGTLSSSLLVVTHGDVPVSSTLSLLRRQSSTFIKLSALQTGYTKEISGVLTAQQHHRTTDFWTPMQRSHYKLTDSQVKISAPGHSSSTLQQ